MIAQNYDRPLHTANETKLCYVRSTVRLFLLLATGLLTFGLLAAAAVAAAIRLACFRGRKETYSTLIRGGAFGVLLALAAFIALGLIGVDLDGLPFHDSMPNGAASVLFGAVAGTTLGAVRAKRWARRS